MGERGTAAVEDRRSDVGPYLAVVAERFDEFVEVGVAATVRRGGDRYRSLALDELRASLRAGLQAVMDDVRDGGGRFATFWRELAVVRARAEFPVEALQQSLDVNERLLVSVAHQLADPDDRMAAVEALHRVHTAARRAQFDSYHAVGREIQAGQRDALDRLGAPIVPLFRGVVLVPIVHAAAVSYVRESLLPAVQRHRARFVVVDVTGLATLDADVARALAELGQATRLLGAEMLLVGLSAATAAALVAEDIALPQLVVHRDLESGLEHALARMGLAIGPRIRG